MSRRLIDERPDAPHGSPSTYANLQCRCDDCKAAWAASVRRKREARYAKRDSVIHTLEHGTSATYQNWGCRCDKCKAAQSEARRRWPNAGKS